MIYIATKTLTLRIPEELHKAIKIKIAHEGISLKDYIIALVEKDLKLETKK